MRSKTHPMLFAAALLAGGLALPTTAEADGWRGRGNGWRAGEAALGAVLGLGAGVVIGSALAPPPPPPIYYYAPTPPPVVIYKQPPVVYAPPPGHWVQPPPYWVPR
jgi:hypothetical protein